MSAPKHTPGWLRVWMQRPRTWHLVSGTGSEGRIVATMRLVLPEDEANFKRLEACWNACSGIADPSVVPEIIDFMRQWGSPADGAVKEDFDRLLARVEGRP